MPRVHRRNNRNANNYNNNYFNSSKIIDIKRDYYNNEFNKFVNNNKNNLISSYIYNIKNKISIIFSSEYFKYEVVYKHEKSDILFENSSYFLIKIFNIDNKLGAKLNYYPNIIELDILNKINHMNGSILLNNIEILARFLNVKVIILLDKSKIEFDSCFNNNNDKISISLRYLSILSKGISWYNSIIFIIFF